MYISRHEYTIQEKWIKTGTNIEVKGRSQKIYSMGAISDIKNIKGNET